MEKALGSWKPRLVNELMQVRAIACTRCSCRSIFALWLLLTHCDGQGFVQRVGSRICKETGFKDMPPHRIVLEPRFRKIFTRSDFLVCVGPSLSLPPGARVRAQDPSLSLPPLFISPSFICRYIERAKFQDVQFKEVTVKVSRPLFPVPCGFLVVFVAASALAALWEPPNALTFTTRIPSQHSSVIPNHSVTPNAQDVDDTAGPLFASGKDYALVSTFPRFVGA
jgi:hypothetical protein